MKTLGIKGLNVTIPYKETVYHLVDRLSEEAIKIGAINTIHYKDGETIGYNTDYRGFGYILEKGQIDPRNKTFYVLGAGGAAKSIVWYLKDHGANVILVTRNIAQAKEKFVEENLPIIDYRTLEKKPSAYGIINTTPIGMYPHQGESPITIELIKKFEIAIDIVYNPRETLFLKNAKSVGLKTFGGLWMLVGQALESERIWQDADFDTVDEKEIYEKVSKEL